MQNYLTSNDQIDLDSPSLGRQRQLTQGLISPSNKTSGLISLSTPVKKDLNNSKSPLANLRLKKSKRRECTPAYSPKKEEEGVKVLSLTEKKPMPKTRLNFDSTGGNDGYLDTDSQSDPKKKKFLNLIEESLNDVGDSYFGHLGSQTTPDVIFRSIFSEEKNDRFAVLVSAVEDILKEVGLKNVSVLALMNTRVVCFDSHSACDVSHLDLMSQTAAVDWNAKHLTFTDRCLLLPATLHLRDTATPSRLVFEVDGDSVRLAVIEIYLAN